MSFASTILLPLLALSSTALAANHEIKVGPGLTFTPSNTNAAASDTITFTFAANTHNVVQGAFDSPCTASQGGIYSGFLSPTSNFVVTVNDTKPIYFYCSAGKHCENGMVGGVNLPASGAGSLEQYSAAAAKAGSSTTPAAVFGGVVKDSSSSSGSASASASGSASATVKAGTSTHATTSATASASSPAKTGGAISVKSTMGGLVGAAAVLVSFVLA